MAKKVTAKEIISLEGVAAKIQSKDPNVFYYSTLPHKSKVFENNKVKKLKEGIILGATGALLLNHKLPITCILAETNSQLPDSRAASKIIEVLDSYLKLNVDPKPLVKKAEEFEVKLKQIMSQSKEAVEVKDKKDLNYFG